MLNKILKLEGVQKIEKRKQALVIGGNSAPYCGIANTIERCAKCAGTWAPSGGSQGQNFCQLPQNSCCDHISPF